MKQFLYKFECGNNRKFKNYTGNIVYFVDKKLSKQQEGKAFYFTCMNASFSIDKIGFVNWDNGIFLDGDFFGNIKDGAFYNGKHNNVKIVKK